MNIHQTLGESKRQTSAEDVFHRLKADIISLRVSPGTKLSEVEVAKSYDVSRQPVREAFMRLGDLSLLQIRPQKATIVRKISLQDLANTRFIRASLEVEVVRIACKIASDENLSKLRKNLTQQTAAMVALDPVLLRDLDYEFHRLICETADLLPAFKVIAENKTHTDRVCTLELSDALGMAETIEDHSDIVDAITQRDETLAVEMTRHHLAHLDATLIKASENHPDFFED